MNIREFKSTDSLNSQFALEITQALTAGIANKGRASLLVSGGRTPKALFNTLSDTALDWSKVDISLVDERWVNEDDSASNTAMVKRELIQNKAAKANFVALKTSHDDAEQGLNEAAANICEMTTPFDVLILGMGEDGHTASIFPCADKDKLALGLDMNSGETLVSMTPATAPHQRISLTLPAILNAEKIYLHLVGAAKKDVLDKAMSSDNAEEMPIRAVLQQQTTPVDVMFAN